MFNYIEAKDPKLADALCTGSYNERSNKITIGGVYKGRTPHLADHEREGLEEDIKHFGCYCPIITWQGYIIDGHHRYEICMRHKQSFRVEEREFEDEISLKRWIIDHQDGRRELEPYVRAELQMEKGVLQERKRSNQHTKGQPIEGKEDAALNQQSGVSGDNSKPYERLAKKAGMSPDTYSKACYITENASEEVKEKLRKGETDPQKERRAIRRSRTKNEGWGVDRPSPEFWGG